MDLSWLSPIEARAAQATPGPWRAMCEGNQYLDGHTREKIVGASRVEGLPRPWSYYYVVPPYQMEHVSRFKDEDAAFIAHARTDIPTLTAAVRAAEARAEKMEKALRVIDRKTREYPDSIWTGIGDLARAALEN